jgi:hypothetical protein
MLINTIVPNDEWVAILSQEWQKRKDDPEVDMNAFKKQVIDWYDNGIGLYVEKKREKGNFPALTSRILDPFIKMVSPRSNLS